MKIRVDDFISGEGVKFIITSENIAENVLLTACVGNDILNGSEEDEEFVLSLLVSN